MITLKWSGNNNKLTQLGWLTLPGMFTKEKVNPPARVTQASRYKPAYLGNPNCLVSGTKEKTGRVSAGKSNLPARGMSL